MPSRTTVLALLLVALTAAVLVVDLARPGLAAPARSAVAAALAPAQRVLAGWDDGRVAELTEERNALAAEVDRLRARARDATELEELARSSTAAVVDRTLLPARVVAVASGSTPVGGRTVTVDVGSEDGVLPDQTVVAVEGLAGRVLRVAPTSADVLLLGDPQVVVGVRFGQDGALGDVQADPVPGLPARGHGQLTLTALGDTQVEVGDRVSTLGSPDDVPYAAGIPLGTVVSVDPDRGQLGRTAVVEPFVDTDTLDLVAVVLREDG
ncbi:rod shape-determining protein MreC [uncultured Serinicoccus sp.]|uniref:rod shape-determining protein MreC n=1 Tax=uncultured Serinicoccus sp. TaxID=735514 RepID=UPI002618EB9B|nr:rod shape-determining protein MreC [uncultured Serinicoccus sp.]